MALSALRKQQIRIEAERASEAYLEAERAAKVEAETDRLERETVAAREADENPETGERVYPFTDADGYPLDSNGEKV